MCSIYSYSRRALYYESEDKSRTIFQEVLSKKDDELSRYMCSFRRSRRERSKDLVPIVYNYNKKNFLQFIYTKWSESIEVGDLYEARFPDKFGNVCVCHVVWPIIISNLFNHSNVVDVHNQAHQYELVLEKKLVTRNIYFYLYTTHYVGIHFTNLWQTIKVVSGKRLRPSLIVELWTRLYIWS